MKNKKYHYFYKITNLINGKYYYGVHNTYNLNDGYMGSGTRISYAINKYGVQSFIKEILMFFDTQEEAFEYESKIVTEDLVKDDNCYNQKCGGDYSWKTTKDTVSVRDEFGNCFRVHKDDERFLKGELVGVTKGMSIAEDNNGNRFYVYKDDIRYQEGTLHHVGKGKTLYKDKNDNVYFVNVNDIRVLNGELVHISKGKKLSVEHKNKIKKSLANVDMSHKTCWVCNETNSIKINKNDLNFYIENGYQKGKKYHKIKNKKLSEKLLEIGHQKGCKNSQYGTCWVYNDKESIKIKKELLDEYLSNGWNKGRKMKFN